MAISITCPVCAASFRLAQRMRGRKIFCPKCGKPLVITSAGVAKRGEGVAVEPAPRPASRGLFWLLLALLVLVALVPGGLVLVLVVRGEPDTQKQLSEKDGEQSQARLDPPEQTGAPPVSPTREGDLVPEVKVEVQKELAELQPKLLVPDMPARTPTRRPTVLEQKHLSDLAFSPDGKMLATASWDETVTLWDVPTGKSLKTLVGSGGVTLSIAFSPDSKTLVSSAGDRKGRSDDTTMRGQIKLWDVATGANTLTFPGNRGAASVAFSPDGKMIASSTYGSLMKQMEEINLWDAVTGKELLSIRPPVSGEAAASYSRSVAFSPDSKTLATASSKGTVRLWDVATGKNVKTLEGIKAATDSSSVAFSRDGKTVLATSASDLVMWDADSGKVIRTLGTGSWGMALSPDGKTVATGSGDNSAGSGPSTIKLWDVATGKNTTTFPGTLGFPALFAFSSHGNVLVVGSLVSDGGGASALGLIGLWDLQSAK